VRSKIVAVAALVLFAASAEAADRLDPIFSQFSGSTPGCAFAIEHAGEPAIARAYGMSDLEHGVPNTVDSIFEAGSVSKQFTAAAVLMLVQDGKLKLSDDIRKYLPELPDYGTPITVDELLSHTSGLRDWGNVEDIAGWPRTDRVYTLTDVLNIAARQKALNYKPGTAWSYTNTGFNLLAIIVQRVSGKSLADFTRARIFVPLGMTHTQWRDNFRRIVPGRAIAYDFDGKAYEQMMPFENAYGNGGLLTTVGDLMVWNRALTDVRLGDFVTTALQQPAKLANGHSLNYARGLFVLIFHGAREISHSGSTAGYRAWLGRFPDNGLSIAVLCNAGDAPASKLGYMIADLYLPKKADASTAASPKIPPPQLSEWYADTSDGAPIHIVRGPNGPQTESGAAIEGAPGGIRVAGTDMAILPDGSLQTPFAGGDVRTLAPADAYQPSMEQKIQIRGIYRSTEADTTYVVALAGDALQMTVEERPDGVVTLKPTYKDAFATANHLFVRLVRGPDGRVVALRLSNDRVWDLRFDRVP
jgi:CubicO group peptidase (beta-lactamase class C family)